VHVRVHVLQNINIDGISITNSSSNSHSNSRMFSTMTKEADARAKARDDHILGAPIEKMEKMDEGEEIKEKRVRLSDVSLSCVDIHILYMAIYYLVSY